MRSRAWIAPLVALFTVGSAVHAGPKRGATSEPARPSTSEASNPVKRLSMRGGSSSSSSSGKATTSDSLGRAPEGHDTARSDAPASPLRAAASSGALVRTSSRENLFRGTFPKESGGGFSVRGAHAHDTKYPADPTKFIEKEGAKENHFATHLFNTTSRGSMNDAFTASLVKANPRSPFAAKLTKAGGSLSEAGVSRNHILADSTLKGLLVNALVTLHGEVLANKGRVDPVKRAALENLCKAMGAPEAFKTLESIYTNPKMLENVHLAQGPFASAHEALSVNTTNVRLGDAALNERIANSFDPHLEKGAMSAATAKIHSAVLDLGESGLVGKEQAAAAVEPARDKATKAPLTST